MKKAFIFLVFTGLNFIYSQSLISHEAIDSQIFIFQKNNNLQIQLTYENLSTERYPIFSHQYKNQLIKYLEKNPNDLDSLAVLYELQNYLYENDGAKNTLLRYKNQIDKILSKDNKNLFGLLHASEYYRIQNDKFIQKNYLDSAFKYYPNELKTLEFVLNYYVFNQDFEQAKRICNQILCVNPKHLYANFILVNLNFYENAYYGIRNDYSLIQKLISQNPDIPFFNILKTYLMTLSYVLSLTDYDIDEIPFKKWHLPQVLKPTSDSLYYAWLNHLPSLTHKSTAHLLMMVIKLIEKDTIKAREHFQQAIQFDPYFLLTYYNYYQFHFELENYKECIKVMHNLLNFIPSENHYLLLAKAYFFSKNYYQTEEILKKLLSDTKNLKEPYVYTSVAQYYLKFRKMNEVQSYLNLAKQIDPRDPEYNFTAAMYQIILGNKKQAQEHLFTYLEFFQNDPVAWKWLKILSK